MAYLFSQFWIFVLLAIALGLFVSWASRDASNRREGPGWLAPAGIVFAVGLFLAAMKWLPGFWGLALEVALLLFGAYIFGCALGCRFGRAPAGDGAENRDQTTGLRAHTPTAEATPLMGALALAPSDETEGSFVSVAQQGAPPAPAPPVADEHAHPGARPPGLAGPRDGKADDLKLVKGIGRQNEARLHALGVWHFDQIAAWTHDNVAWIGSYLAFPGRIDRENWVEQATHLARGEKTEFARRVEAGEVPTSRDAS